MNASLAQDFRAKRLQILPNVGRWMRAVGGTRQIVGFPRSFWIVEKRIALRQTLPEMGIGEQQLVLSMFRQFDGFLAEFEGSTRVASGVGALSDLFFYFGVFDHAAQNPGANHQNVVLLFFRNLVGRSGLSFGALKVSIVEMNVGGIEKCRAHAVMIWAQLVDGLGRIEMLQSFAAKHGQAAAVIMTTSAGFAFGRRRTLPSALNIAIDSFLQLQ